MRPNCIGPKVPWFLSEDLAMRFAADVTGRTSYVKEAVREEEIGGGKEEVGFRDASNPYWTLFRSLYVWQWCTYIYITLQIYIVE